MIPVDKKQLPENWQFVVDLLSTADSRSCSDLQAQMSPLPFLAIIPPMVEAGIICRSGRSVLNIHEHSEGWVYEPNYALSTPWFAKYRGLCNYERACLYSGDFMNPETYLARLPINPDMSDYSLQLFDSNVNWRHLAAFFAVIALIVLYFHLYQ